ncbi:MAG: polymerase subunit alpha, partial [Frondihabitans sp.]|nr:polymerase subunit alpha [Frondihabitans sp.]
MGFTHLHVASSFSAHYGTATPGELVGIAVEAGADAAAITDRDGLYGAIRHLGACRRNGIDPIVGVELGVQPDAAATSAGRRRSAAETDRVVVLAHGHNDGAGWASLCRLISAAHGRATRTVSGSANSVATITKSRIRAFL